METLTKILLVGAGGAAGANIRYWLGGWLANFWNMGVWSTFTVNVSGSLVIGLFMGLALELNWNQNWRLFVAIGILGGYTTYSTFAYEALRLLADRDYVRALIYIEGTALCSVFGAWLGLVGARAILGGRV
ncbi:MAG TPA: fluoride efflux transporter CrcB [Fimbriimonadaceae bacterium]|nr:fluoride efflux transporter CrcB [Fimbriimonadaceae bacterium]